MLPQTFANHTPLQPFIILSTTESTNNYAMAKLHAGMVSNGVCFLALQQTAGRGQRLKRWVSAPGENITMTSVFQLSRVISSNISGFPFALSAAMALGCYDFIKDLCGDQVFIKWPNDVYVGDRKAAGILIENVYQGSSLTATLVGVGVNLNQRIFPVDAGNPVSLSQVTGKQYPVCQAGRLLHRCLLNRYHSLEKLTAAEVLREYNAHLWHKNQPVKIKRNNVTSSVTIQEAALSGELIVIGAMEQRLSSGDVEFLLS